ncbi:MAG: hypothetical protein WC101_04845 [Candidatus Gracilibacteria bacterium]
MQYYQTRAEKITGSNFNEMRKKAEKLFDAIKKKSKRKPYIRSAYFKKDKIFLDYFWGHLYAKQNRRDRIRRIQFYEAAIELLKNTRLQPVSVDNPNNKNETLYRFYGKTNEGCAFIVQIKEHKKSGQKYFISIFPE